MEGKLALNANDPIVYRRGAVTQAMTATLGTSNFAQTDMQGVEVIYASQDFRIQVEELLLNGVAIIPDVNDEIDHVDKFGRTRTYKVLPMSNVPAYTWAEPEHIAYRVHTKDMTE